MGLRLLEIVEPRLIQARSLIRTIGAASTVLLKNKGNVLPFNKPSTLAIIGKHILTG